MKREPGSRSPLKAIFIGAAALLLMVFGVWYDGRRPMGKISRNSIDGARTGTDRPPSSKYMNIRNEAVAGSFYPAEADILTAQVDAFLAAAQVQPIPGRARVILSPHAGHEYSGLVAAHAFKTLVGSGYERVVLIGNSHHARFDGIRADGHDAWSTPLGPVAVDREFISRLAAACPAVSVDAAPHDPEHSLEVMVPFLIRTLGPDVRIVPLLFGSGGGSDAADLAAALRPLLDDRTVVIISSDLSHYPKYDDANTFDGETVRSVLTGDVEKFRERLNASPAGSAKPDTLACADIAIESGLILSRSMGLAPRLLKYANSGDIVPDTKGRVVGYAAMAFDGPVPEQPPPARELNQTEQREALDIARQALASSFAGDKYSPPAVAAVFSEKRGVFVTLRKDGQLRGCIGVFEPDRVLAEAIADMALAAAFEDRRFSPLATAELSGIEIEISVLSPMVRVRDAGDVEVGEHGVYVRQGVKNGVFLPQVAAEQGWSKNEFLANLCQEKAGLPADCWRDSRTEIYVFTAQVF